MLNGNKGKNDLQIRYPYNIIVGLALVLIVIVAIVLTQGLLTPILLPVSVYGYQLAGGKV